MPYYDNHFTVAEARQWVPRLREKFARIQALYAEMDDLKADFEKVRKLISMNGHAPKKTEFEIHLEELQNQVKEIVDAGIQVKDVARGLVDFPHMKDGEEVFLCWQLSDDDLEFWHRIEDGFPGRQPL